MRSKINVLEKGEIRFFVNQMYVNEVAKLVIVEEIIKRQKSSYKLCRVLVEVCCIFYLLVTSTNHRQKKQRILYFWNIVKINLPDGMQHRTYFTCDLKVATPPKNDRQRLNLSEDKTEGPWFCTFLLFQIPVIGNANSRGQLEYINTY